MPNTHVLIFMQKTIGLIFWNGGSIYLLIMLHAGAGGLWAELVSNRGTSILFN